MKKTPIRLSDHFTCKTLLRFTAPSMIMMVFSSIYGIVDGFFVSNFAGKTAFAAVNFTIPFLIIISTPGFMLGTGGSALVAKIMGEGRDKEAKRVFSLMVWAAIVLGIVISGISLVFLRPILQGMGAEGTLLHDSMRYGRILVLATPLYILQMLFHSFVAAAEKPKLGLWVTVASGISNMILDALLVGVLSLGLEGAALATAFSQAVGGLVPLIYFCLPNPSRLRMCRPAPDLSALRKASTNGASELMSNLSMSLVSMLYNIQLLAYAGENGIAAYGTMMYVNMVFLSVFFGYSTGSSPIISFHYGAENHAELKNLKQRSFLILSVFSAAMLFAGYALAKPLSRLFVGYDPELYDMTVRGFYIFAPSFPLAGFAIFLSGFFTALNDGLTSAAISFLRTVVFQVAAVLLLPLRFGINGIWASLVVAEVMATCVGFVFLSANRKKYHY